MKKSKNFCFLRNFIQSASFSRIIYIPPPPKGHDHRALVSLCRKKKVTLKPIRPFCILPKVLLIMFLLWYCMH